LLPLRDQLARELEEKRRGEEAEEEFARLCAAEHTVRELDPDAFRRAPGALTLDPIGLRVLHDLFRLRDEIASRRDRSPHRIFPDRTLVDLARAQPATRAELAHVDGLPRWRLEREEQMLLDCIRTAREAGPLPRTRPRPARDRDA